MGVVTKRTITEDVVSQEITVGDIISNPYFDANLDYRIVTYEDDGSWTDVYNSREADDDPPAELLVKRISYLTLGDNTLIMEVHC